MRCMAHSTNYGIYIKCGHVCSEMSCVPTRQDRSTKRGVFATISFSREALDVSH